MSHYNPTQGRWPANFIHDGSEQVTDLLKDSARFFYCAKASKADRDAGCEGIDARFAPTMGNGIGGKEHDPVTATPKHNHHPTVKPTDLMRYLCRLVTPPDGLVLDPFMGSGSTGKAAALEGFSFIGIEREAEYVAIAQARINHVTND
jgi:site-specific DNA-methyltransferase (adenine-specific)